MENTQAALAAKAILDAFWLSQVQKVARRMLANEPKPNQVRAVELYAPTLEQYADAQSLLDVLLTPPTSELAVAAPRVKKQK